LLFGLLELFAVNMKAIFSGLEGSGKSLYLAETIENVAERNAKWFKKSGIQRSIVSNLHFSKDFVSKCEKIGVPIEYWDNIETLVQKKDVDVVIDEVGNYFDSRLWSDLSLDVRRWLSQADKMGIEIYGTAQDFAQVDKAFRRLTTDLFHLTKVVGSRRPSATRPPVKRIWGLVAKFRLDPQGYEEDKKKYLSLFPSFFFIRAHYCKLFDTGQEIKGGNYSPLRHIERTCIDSKCLMEHGKPFRKVIHV